VVRIVREPPLERLPEVVPLGLEAIEPGRLVGPGEMRFGFPRKLEEETRVTALKVVGLARRLQSLAGVLADRF
jgi:hypothetical protein